MTATSTAYAAIVVDVHCVSIGNILRASERLVKDGRLDVLIHNADLTLEEAEASVRGIYEIACKTEHAQKVTVFPYCNSVRHPWEIVWVPPDCTFELACPCVQYSLGDDAINLTKDVHASRSIPKFRNAALGGTFDHFHVGHKLLLTVAGLVTSDLLIIGISGPELLTEKKHKEAFESYEFREKSVREFMKYVYPDLQIRPVMINDMYGPTMQEENIDGLIVSVETEEGANKINSLRREKGWNELQVVKVFLIGGNENKLSSTDIRQKVIARKGERLS